MVSVRKDARRLRCEKVENGRWRAGERALFALFSPKAKPPPPPPKAIERGVWWWCAPLTGSSVDGDERELRVRKKARLQRKYEGWEGCRPTPSAPSLLFSVWATPPPRMHPTLRPPRLGGPAAFPLGRRRGRPTRAAAAAATDDSSVAEPSPSGRASDGASFSFRSPLRVRPPPPHTHTRPKATYLTHALITTHFQ